MIFITVLPHVIIAEKWLYHLSPSTVIEVLDLMQG